MKRAAKPATPARAMPALSLPAAPVYDEGMAPVAEAPKPVEAAVPWGPVAMVELTMAKGAELGTWTATGTVV